MSKKDKLADFEKIRVDWNKKLSEIAGMKTKFPKYTTQILNIANQNSQGTRAKVVGQMSELIQECPEKTYRGWKEWYLKQHPEAIEQAVDKIMPMINNMREAMEKIDENMVRDWVKDLVLTKTAEGLIIQEAVIKQLAELEGKEWRLATVEEESKNIDGYIGKKPVSIKPHSYSYKSSSVREQINVEIIYYKKTDKYLYIYRKPET